MAEQQTGRCMKCRENVKIADAKETTLKGKVLMKAVKGKCPKCGTTVFKIVGKA
jgi:predicted RNA-binding Zn-ribbon protein involved in translation (DUF1610 family)